MYFPDTLGEKCHIFLESLEEWCSKSLGKIISIDRIENKRVLYKVKKKRNILYKVKKKRRLILFVTSCAGTAF
jgi:hypothetical protein